MVITQTAFAVLLFSLAVLAAAAPGLALGRRRRRVRAACARLLAGFGVTALAAGYLWLAVAPELDHRLLVRERPWVAPEGADVQDI